LDSRSTVWKHVSEEVKDSVTKLFQSYRIETEQITISFEQKQHGEGFRAPDLPPRRILVEFLINSSQLFQESLLVAQHVSLTREVKHIAFLANRLPDKLIQFCREKVEFCCQNLHQLASSKDANMDKRIDCLTWLQIIRDAELKRPLKLFEDESKLASSKYDESIQELEDELSELQQEFTLAMQRLKFEECTNISQT